MQNSQTTNEQREKLNTQNNIESNDKENYPLLTREPLENTPFHIVGNEKIGYKIAYGKYNFNDTPHKTQQDAVYWYNGHMWEIVMSLIAIGFKIANDNAKENPHEYSEENIIKKIKNNKEQGA